MLASYLTRLALTTGSSFTRGHIGPLDSARMPMRVWFSDIDINGHINNGRYLTLMDFARLDHSIRTGMAKEALKRKWWPLAGAATVKFRKELKPLERFEAVTRIASWDHKWLYFEHRLVKGDVLHTIAFVKAVVKKGKDTIPPAEVMASIGYLGEAPEPSDELATWMEMQRQ